MQIEAKNLGMRYATGRLALQSASFTVSAGEFAVILGANGSGKSTMMRIIAGITKPTEGAVRLAGQDITTLTGRDLAKARMGLGMVFQHANLVKRRSVIANVVCGTLGRHRSLATSLGILPKGEFGHAMQCLERVGLTKFAHQRASTLSGGQAQRASIARALAQRPHALLADEPIASLDPEASEEVMRLLRQLAKDEGMAVLAVLHQPELARRYADRLLGLRKGVIAFADAPANVSDDEIDSLYEGFHPA
ncbi:MAG TPA: phosphonate ABC transporter ATP-binding protein [Acidocella sp.]|jgi:phosphonate transport system ATP-binding protein|uniref:phosphonate ABC transporter ATP-binding protein n=1 Tax=Acidocella sp. TaxID=50710 RepID=UPI002C297E0A|nr:phosphonate ABC transporter ATP-binding protein [Acidocella sp.]HVE22808.1 phosphonate ABC transporter ATP-binding protein [Acidocella sp.]